MPKLTELKVKNAKPGVHSCGAARRPCPPSCQKGGEPIAKRYADGGGLYLEVKPSGAKSWILRVQHQRRRQDIGLGGYPVVTLADAREAALKFRRMAKGGENVRAAKKKASVRIPTFAEAVDACHKELSKGWSDKTAAAFKSSLEMHANPKIGHHRVDEIESEEMILALAPLWTSKPEQAKKLRARMGQVLAFAKARGWRADRPPEGREVRMGLAKQPDEKHFAAMPFDDVPTFFSSQWGEPETSARMALLFTILTAARSGEVRGARWEHIDLEEKLWNRPGELMKSGKPHTVTLSSAAISVLDRVRILSGGVGLIFPGQRAGSQLSDMTLLKVLRTSGKKETVHGFRSSFRDWAAEKTSFPREIAEAALAHEDGTKVERAYRRTDFREKRAALLEAWGQFVAPSISQSADNVVSLQEARSA